MVFVRSTGRKGKRDEKKEMIAKEEEMIPKEKKINDEMDQIMAEDKKKYEAMSPSAKEKMINDKVDKIMARLGHQEPSASNCELPNQNKTNDTN